VGFFWNKNKDDLDEENIDQEHSPEAKNEVHEPQSTPRVTRKEYKEMKRSKEASESADHKQTMFRDRYGNLFLRYVLPPIMIYLAYMLYLYVNGNFLAKFFGNTYFWILDIIVLIFFTAIIAFALLYMFERMPTFTHYFGAISWFAAVYFYIFYLIHHDARGPILAAMILFVTGVIQLTHWNHYIKGTFIVLAVLYGNYLTALDFPEVWLILGVGGSMILLKRRWKYR